MDAVNDRQDDAPLLSGHQDLIPNSDAARLRLSLDSPTEHFPVKHSLFLTLDAGNAPCSAYTTYHNCFT